MKKTLEFVPIDYSRSARLQVAGGRFCCVLWVATWVIFLEGLFKMRIEFVPVDYDYFDFEGRNELDRFAVRECCVLFARWEGEIDNE